MYVLVTFELQVLYVSDIDYAPRCAARGHALYDISGPEYRSIHFHHKGDAFLHKVQSTLFARVSFLSTPDSTSMLFRAAGTTEGFPIRKLHLVAPQQLTECHSSDSATRITRELLCDLGRGSRELVLPAFLSPCIV